MLFRGRPNKESVRAQMPNRWLTPDTNIYRERQRDRERERERQGLKAMLRRRPFLFSSKELDCFFSDPKHYVPKLINVHKTFHCKDRVKSQVVDCKEFPSLYCSVYLTFSKSSYICAFASVGEATSKA